MDRIGLVNGGFRFRDRHFAGSEMDLDAGHLSERRHVVARSAGKIGPGRMLLFLLVRGRRTDAEA